MNLARSNKINIQPQNAQKTQKENKSYTLFQRPAPLIHNGQRFFAWIERAFFFCSRNTRKDTEGSIGEDMTKLLYEDESYRVIGACFEVYQGQGCGFPVNFEHCPKLE